MGKGGGKVGRPKLKLGPTRTIFLAPALQPYGLSSELQYDFVRSCQVYCREFANAIQDRGSLRKICEKNYELHQSFALIPSNHTPITCMRLLHRLHGIF